MTPATLLDQIQCSRCGTPLSCAGVRAGVNCWCKNYPAVLDPQSGGTCLCRTCLVQRIDQTIHGWYQSNSLDAMLEIASSYRTEGELLEGIDFIVEDSAMVFSRWYHLKRGTCCGSGCRHCPYGQPNVACPEQ